MQGLTHISLFGFPVTVKGFTIGQLDSFTTNNSRQTRDNGDHQPQPNEKAMLKALAENVLEYGSWGQLLYDERGMAKDKINIFDLPKAEQEWLILLCRYDSLGSKLQMEHTYTDDEGNSLTTTINENIYVPESDVKLFRRAHYEAVYEEDEMLNRSFIKDFRRTAVENIDVETLDFKALYKSMFTLKLRDKVLYFSAPKVGRAMKVNADSPLSALQALDFYTKDETGAFYPYTGLESLGVAELSLLVGIMKDITANFGEINSKLELRLVGKREPEVIDFLQSPGLILQTMNGQ